MDDIIDMPSTAKESVPVMIDTAFESEKLFRKYQKKMQRLCGSGAQVRNYGKTNQQLMLRYQDTLEGASVVFPANYVPYVANVQDTPRNSCISSNATYLGYKCRIKHRDDGDAKAMAVIVLSDALQCLGQFLGNRTGSNAMQYTQGQAFVKRLKDHGPAIIYPFTILTLQARLTKRLDVKTCQTTSLSLVMKINLSVLTSLQ